MEVVLDRGKNRGRATKAEGVEHLLVIVEASLLIGNGGAEMQSTAMASEAVGTLQGLLLPFAAAPCSLLLLEGVEVVQFNGGEETQRLADGVVFEQQPPATVVEEQLQGPEGAGAAVEGAEDALAVLDGAFQQWQGRGGGG